ncbi:hypothetical protein [Blastococcus saxobsidens]|uniref:Uncharacterized protein n=1 Tax=Blastococcus saxobsidens (strain DD2) TaxID=1146883 RepID=H6RPN0_BLASD|nr:hypothetical protein [Blastococcus saxobsidens]CCG05289.1 conserved protein of unknown function [Blastococcus saxobsidens DD2]
MTQPVTGPAEQWRTDEELAAAVAEFTRRTPGYVVPAAYGVARLDDGALTFGEVNDLGHTRRLPAVVLGQVCGYRGRTSTYRLTAPEFERAVTLLTPAAAAVHRDHPNLWSWRDLLEQASPSSAFLAFFIADARDEPVGPHDAVFRSRLSGQ